MLKIDAATRNRTPATFMKPTRYDDKLRQMIILSLLTSSRAEQNYSYHAITYLHCPLIDPKQNTPQKIGCYVS